MNPTLITASKPSAKQQKLKRCMLYARAAMRNTTLFELYSTGLKDGELPFNKAFSDAYHPPKIVKIDLDEYRGNQGDVIRIKATDDFKVVRIRIFIFTSYHQLLEKGCARNNGLNYRWTYKAKTSISEHPGIYIRVTAYDLAGNRKSVNRSILL